MSHLSVSLPFNPDVAVYPRGAIFGPRVMHDYEFIWILEGTAQYSYEQNGKTFSVPLVPSTVLLSHPGRRETVEWDGERSARHGYFHFSLVECGPDWPRPDTWPLMRIMEAGDLLDVLSRRLVSWSGNSARHQQNLLAATFLGAFLTGETQVGSYSPQRYPEVVEKALEYIYRRLEADATATFELEAIARVACVSPEHLCRVFKAATGHSPLETVRLARLDRAALLLSRSNFPVSQVARLTGFVSPFHFSRAFKNAYAMSPRDFQRAAALGEELPQARLVRRLYNS